MPIISNILLFRIKSVEIFFTQGYENYSGVYSGYLFVSYRVFILEYHYMQLCILGYASTQNAVDNEK